MDSFFYVNADKSCAFRLVGRDLTRVDFKRTLLGDSIQTECRLQESKASSEDVMRIRQLFTEASQDDFNQVLANMVAYTSLKLNGHGEIVRGTLQIETA